MSRRDYNNLRLELLPADGSDSRVIDAGIINFSQLQYYLGEEDTEYLDPTDEIMKVIEDDQWSGDVYAIADGDTDEVVGMTILDAKTAESGQKVMTIDQITIDEKRRSQGIGSRALRLIEMQARDEGCEAVSLLSVDTAVEFYHKNGYFGYANDDSLTPMYKPLIDRS